MRLRMAGLCFVAGMMSAGATFGQVPHQDRISLSDKHSLLFMRPFDEGRCAALKAVEIDGVKLGDALEGIPGWTAARHVCVPDKAPGALLCEYGIERTGQIFVYQVYEGPESGRSPIVLLAFASRVNNQTPHDDIVAWFEKKYGAFTYATGREDGTDYEYVVTPRGGCDVDYNVSLRIGVAKTHIELVLKIYDKTAMGGR